MADRLQSLACAAPVRISQALRLRARAHPCVGMASGPVEAAGPSDFQVPGWKDPGHHDGDFIHVGGMAPEGKFRIPTRHFHHHIATGIPFRLQPHCLELFADCGNDLVFPA